MHSKVGHAQIHTDKVICACALHCHASRVPASKKVEANVSGAKLLRSYSLEMKISAIGESERPSKKKASDIPASLNGAERRKKLERSVV